MNISESHKNPSFWGNKTQDQKILLKKTPQDLGGKGKHWKQ